MNEPAIPTTSEEIYREFRGMVSSGRLIPGDRLPSVRQLARDLGVAPGTVARAYRQLEQTGVVHTRGSAGTRVSPDASGVPAEVLTAARALRAAARRADLSLDEVADTLRAMWSAP